MAWHARADGSAGARSRHTSRACRRRPAGRKTPSVAAIVQPGGGGGFQKLFFGQEEIAIPQAGAGAAAWPCWSGALRCRCLRSPFSSAARAQVGSIEAACEQFPKADVLINFASYRRRVQEQSACREGRWCCGACLHAWAWAGGCAWGGLGMSPRMHGGTAGRRASCAAAAHARPVASPPRPPRSAFESSMDALRQPTIRVVAVIAEARSAHGARGRSPPLRCQRAGGPHCATRFVGHGPCPHHPLWNFPRLQGVPERDTKTMIAYARDNAKIIIGPATVGGVQVRRRRLAVCLGRARWRRRARVRGAWPGARAGPAQGGAAPSDPLPAAPPARFTLRRRARSRLATRRARWTTL